MLFCHAVLPRAGLGNRLFPWARCVIYAHLHALPVIAPSWVQMKVGPLVRGEIDLRLYHNLFHVNPTHIRGLKRAYLAGFAHKANEPEHLGALLTDDVDYTVVIFSEERDRF